MHLVEIRYREASGVVGVRGRAETEAEAAKLALMRYARCRGLQAPPATLQDLPDDVTVTRSRVPQADDSGPIRKEQERPAEIPPDGQLKGLDGEDDGMVR